MTGLFAPAVFLPLTHFCVSSSRLRDIVVEKIGERPYQGLYSLVTLVAFYWLIAAYRAAPMSVLWLAPPALKLAMAVVILVGFVLVIVGLLTPNPTVVGLEGLFDQPGIVKGILRVTRNPFLWGVGLWALAHIVANGDVASLLFFGSIGSLGLLGAPLIDAKKARRHGPAWQSFAGQTSSVPFLAIAQGRQELVLAEIGWWRIALAVLVFAVALYGHRWAFGVPALPFV